jgi:hypothetical protein
VREDDELLTFAVEYARTYTGEFDFLIEAQRHVQLTGTLPIPVARGVLNCARHDLRVQLSLPSPPLIYDLDGGDGDAAVVNLPTTSGSRSREGPRLERRLPRGTARCTESARRMTVSDGE